MKSFIKGIEKAEGATFNYNGTQYCIAPIDWRSDGYYIFQIGEQDADGECYVIRFYKDKMVWYQDGNYIDTFMLILTDYETASAFVKSLQSEMNYIKRK